MRRSSGWNRTTVPPRNILNAANEVIANNTERKSKTLWTENPEGEKIHFRQFMNGFEEAEYVVGDISKKHREGILPITETVPFFTVPMPSHVSLKRNVFWQIFHTRLWEGSISTPAKKSKIFSVI